LKRLLPAFASETQAQAMFAQEAHLGARVTHPNVVRVLDAGHADGLPYLVLEHVPGIDLWRLLRWLRRSERSLDLPLATFVAHELLLGLHAVHEARAEDGTALGLVHRDVSPSNVLLSVHGDVQLADFGIARALLAESFPQAALARSHGKLGYLSPEQVAGAEVDRRSDVFAAAALTAELFIGEPLFVGASELATLLAIRDADLSRLDRATERLPAHLVRILRPALEREVATRTPTAAQLASALAESLPSRDLAGIRADLSAIVSEAAHLRVPSSANITAVRAALKDDARHDDARKEQYQLGATAETITNETWSFASVVEGLRTGKFASSCWVKRTDEGAPRALADWPDLARHVPTSTTPSAAHCDRDYDIATEGAARALAQALLERETGLLVFEQGGTRKEVFVVGGIPEFVSSNMASELLGEFLVARGVISRGELEMALAVMPRFEGRLGETLTGLGLIDAMELFQLIATQVEEKLLELFTWESGHARFTRGVTHTAPAFPLSLDGWQVLEEGIRRRTASGLITFASGQSFVVERPAPRGLAQAPLSPVQRHILDRATRPITLTQLGATLPHDPRDPRRLIRELGFLLALGAVRSS
jgi:serine/threonine-protein kinase